MTLKHILTPDGLTLFVRHWHLDNPNGVVVLAHGVAEHSGRYEHVAATLNAAGYAVAALDHRTHGKSEGAPRSYVTHMGSFVDDLKLFWDAIAAHYPGKQQFMIGQSMGGQIALHFALRHQAEMAGLVVSAPGILPGASISTLVVKSVKLLAHIAPKLDMTALESTYISRDPAVVESYNTDPLNFRGKIKAGMGSALLSGGEVVLANAQTLHLPMLILHGGDDQIVPPAASQRLADTAGAADKTLKIYAGLYHEIFNEPEQADVLADVIAWLDAHVA